TAVLDATDVTAFEAPHDLVRQIRAPIVVLGPLLARTGRARVSLPGGDEIGARPVELHVRGLERMGATVRSEHGFLVAEAPSPIGSRRGPGRRRRSPRRATSGSRTLGPSIWRCS